MTVTLAGRPVVQDLGIRADRRRNRRLELGLGLVVIAVPLAIMPSTAGPFLDVKLVLLMAGAVVVWAAGRVRHTLALPAAAWMLIGCLAAVRGVDPWQSLTGSERTANGLLLLGASCFLLIAATATPASIHRRVAKWLLWTSTASAVVALTDRFLPGTLPGLGDLSLEGGTIGNPVFLSVLTAAGIAAAVGLEATRPRVLIPVLVVLSSTMALTTKRGGWIAAVVGLGIALLKARPPRRHTLLVVVVVATAAAGWIFIDTVARTSEPLTGAGRFSQLTTGSAQTRVTAARALTRAWADKPLLGWGPGNTWPAYLSSVTERELDGAERGMDDAHNIFLEAAVTTGALGLSALLFLFVLTVREITRAPRSSGWAAGASAALLVGHLLQPVNVSLTPLLFVLAGLACSRTSLAGGDPGGPGRSRPARPGRWGGGVVLVAALGLSVAMGAASAFERHGRVYASEDALRLSHAVAPWRFSAGAALALHLALDGYTGDPAAAKEAAALARETVRRHPWHPIVRLNAADVHLVLRDREGALRWIESHVERFPGERRLLDMARAGTGPPKSSGP